MDFLQMFDMIVHIDKTLGILLSQYGTWVYAVLFAIIFAETGLVLFPFLPGDSLIFIAGAFCATGDMSAQVLIILLFSAAVLGNALNYWIGSMIGHKVFTHDYKWIDKKALHKTHVFFEKHGGKTIILSRFVPIFRTFAPFVAGVSEMSFLKFQFYNIVGALVWVGGLVWAGYAFGNVPFIRDHLNTIALIGVASAVVPLVLGALYRWVRKFV